MPDKPTRLVLVEFVLQDGDGPVGVVHMLGFADGQSKEIYSPWQNEKAVTQAALFLERTPEGNIARLVPSEERSVPDEWRAAIQKFEIKRQKVMAIMTPQWP